MDPIILDDIPFTIDLPALLERLHIEKGNSQALEMERLAADAQPVASPKALYKVSFIEERGDDYIVVDGVRFTSRVLAVNTAKVHRVFPFVATCGMEVEEWSQSLDDVLIGYYADAIKEAALRAAARAVWEHMEAGFNLETVSTMNPGSLKDWPIEEQRPLFELLGDPERTIGLRLTESFLMFPVKSISGLRFTTDIQFNNCQLCPREVCPGRRADYDPVLYKQKYGLH